MHRDGFVVVDLPVTTPEDLNRARELLDGLFDRFDRLPKHMAYDLGDVKQHSGRPQIPEILRPTVLEPRLLDTLAFANCRALASELLGESVRSWYDHAIYKPPGGDTDVGWHQDQAYVSGQPNRAVHFWLPLQDVNEANGCMQFLPGSHTSGLLPHRHRGHRAEAHALVTDEVDLARAVTCPIDAGMATIHLPATVHCTGSNRSNSVRRAWILQFRVDAFARPRRGRRVLRRVGRSGALVARRALEVVAGR